MNPVRSGSLTFIIVLALCASLTLAVIAGVSGYGIRRAAHDTRGASTEAFRESLYSRAAIFFAALSAPPCKDVRECAERTQQLLSLDATALSAAIFTRTGDESYFRAAEILEFNASRKFPFVRGSELREESGMIRKGLYEITVDSTLTSADGLHFMSVYGPVRLERGEAVIQLSFSIDPARAQSAAAGAERIRGILFIAAIIGAIALLGITIAEAAAVSSLMKGLTVVVKEAAGGETAVRMDPAADRDIVELAESFNMLIGELREKDRKMAELGARDSAAELFKSGVTAFKENRADDAEALFRSHLLLRGGSFGSCFNLGIIKARRRQFAEALSYFEQAAALNPDNAQTAEYIQKVQRMSSGQS
jgi:tetratricopeptide (TPR) repeat protein